MASTRRLKEEMGFEVELTELFSFVYQTKLEVGLSEHEYDHVLLGWFEGVPTPDPSEVAEWKWIDIPALLKELKCQPEIYTYWFRIAVDQFVRAIPAN